MPFLAVSFFHNPYAVPQNYNFISSIFNSTPYSNSSSIDEMKLWKKTSNKQIHTNKYNKIIHGIKAE